MGNVQNTYYLCSMVAPCRRTWIGIKTTERIQGDKSMESIWRDYTSNRR